MTIGQVAKFLTALAGAGVQAIALGLVDGDAQGWVTVAVSALTAAAVFLVPNQVNGTAAEAPPGRPDTASSTDPP